jgi:hypothetical protein
MHHCEYEIPPLEDIMSHLVECLYSLYPLKPSLTFSGSVALLWHKVLQTPELHSRQQHLGSRVLKCSLALTFPVKVLYAFLVPYMLPVGLGHACHFTFIFHLTL